MQAAPLSTWSDSRGQKSSKIKTPASISWVTVWCKNPAVVLVKLSAKLCLTQHKIRSHNNKIPETDPILKTSRLSKPSPASIKIMLTTFSFCKGKCLKKLLLSKIASLKHLIIVQTAIISAKFQMVNHQVSCHLDNHLIIQLLSPSCPNRRPQWYLLS